MKRLLLIGATVLALSLPTTALAGPSIDQFEDGGGGCGAVGHVENRDSWRWYAYWDGGGYVRLWTDVWLCTSTGFEYVGGFWN